MKQRKTLVCNFWKVLKLSKSLVHIKKPQGCSRMVRLMPILISEILRKIALYFGVRWVDLLSIKY